MKIYKIIIGLSLLVSAFHTNAALLTSTDSSLAFWYDNDVNNRGGISLSRNQLLGTIDAYSTDAFTVSFHLNVTGIVSDWGSILHVGNADTQRWPGFWLTPGNTGLHSRMSTSTDWNNGFTNTSALPVGQDVWTHVVMVDTGANLSLFLNGSLIETINGNGTPYTSESTMNVYAGDPWWAAAIGNIDDIRIYNRAVSLDELSMTPQEVSAPSTLAIFGLSLMALVAKRRSFKK